MKRCPECGRNYNDDSMSFCLDDGSELLFGPASMDEPATAILHSTAAPGDAPTSSQILTTEQTAIFPRGAEAEPQKSLSRLAEKQSFSANRAAKPLMALIAAVLVLVGGFFGYKYFAPTKQIESIAVMPFVNESGNADVEYLSDGMTETLIKSLSQVPNLAVKSRSTVFYYKGKETSPKKIGEELEVQAVLLGRVGGHGDDLKLSLELVNTKTQDVIWTEQYDRKQSDLVSLQSEIAKDVSAKLKLKLSGADAAKVTKTSTADPEAYQAYLKGRYYWNRRTLENIKKAIEQFKAAADKDPNYALAYTGLADCYVILPEYAGTPTSEAIPQAKAYAERAIAIDDQLAEAHASLGLTYQKLWKWAEAEREYKRAIELNPSYATAYHWYCVLLRSLGRFDEAAQMIGKAQELDLLSLVIGNNVVQTYMIRNDFTKMAETSLKLIELDPNYFGGYALLGQSYLKLGRETEAIANLQKSVELSNRGISNLTLLGNGYAVTGKRSEANIIVKELEERYARKESSGGNIAAVYAGLGEKDKAFEWLEKDFQIRSGELTLIRWFQQFEPLRDDPRYKDLLKRMGLPE